MEEQLNRLKDESASGPAGQGEPAGDRLAKLKEDAGTLAKSTEDMMDSLEGNIALHVTCQ